MLKKPTDCQLWLKKDWDRMNKAELKSCKPFYGMTQRFIDILIAVAR